MSFTHLMSRAYSLFIGLAMASLAAYPKAVPGWLGLALISGLLENRYEGIAALKALSKVTFFSIGLAAFFFLLNVLGLLHTQDMDLGQKDVLRKITLALVPAFLLIKGIGEKRMRFWMAAYVTGVIIALLINNVNSLRLYLDTGSANHFLGEHAILQMHIGYFALHLLVAIGIIVQWIFKHHLDRRRFAIGSGVLVLYIILNLILTGSKMGFLTLLAMLGLSFVLMLFRGLGWKRILIIGLCVSGVLLLLVTQTSYLADRFSRMTVSTPIDPSSIESTQARRMAWLCAWDTFMDETLFGRGTGDTQQGMMECYEAKGYSGPASKNLGPHSQYMESGIAVGILGSMAVLLMFFLPFIRTLRLQHIVSSMFFLSFLLACVSESIFERAMGIHLYAVLLTPMLLWMEQRSRDLRAGVKGM